MKRYLVLVTVAFILGIILEEFLWLPVWLWLLFFGLAFSTAKYCFFRCKEKYNYIILLSLCLLGAVWYSLSMYPCLRFSPLIGQVIEGQGFIQTYPRQGSYQQSFTVKTELLTIEDKQIEGLNKLLVKVKWDSEPSLKPGDLVSFRGVLRRPSGPTNPGQFDYQRYLANQQVFFELSCGPRDFKILKFGEGISSMAAIGRAKLADLLSKTLPKEEEILLMGLLFGDVSGMDSRAERAYKRAGVSHLFAVSGFNVSFVLGILWFCLNFIRPPQMARLGLAALILLGYYFLVGWSASIVRACLMSFMALLSLSIGRKNDIYTALAGSALVILLLSPGELFQVGFQLSFLVTLGMVYLTPWLQKLGCGKHLAPTLAAQLTSMPLVAYYFNLLSILSPLLNILAAMVVGLVTSLGLVGAVLTWTIPILAKPVFLACGSMMHYLSQVIIWAAKLSWAAIIVPSPPIFVVILYYLILAAAPFFRYYRYRLRLVPSWTKVLVVLFLGLGLIFSCWPGQRLLEVTFLDVGHGDSIFIKTPHGKRILLDGGGTPASDFPVGQKIVLPYLHKQGIGRLDAIVMSHNHLDHGEGLLELIELIPIGCCYLPPREYGNALEKVLLASCQEKGIPVRELTAGQVLHLEEDLTLEVLHPKGDDGSYGNDHSLVLRLVYGSCSWLLTGDIENKGLEQLLRRSATLEVNLLKLPHHGSISSFNEEFYEEVKPQGVIVSVGSTYSDHPHQDIVDYFTARNIPLYSTKEKGAILTKSNGKKIWLSSVL